MLTGVVNETHFANLTKLTFFTASGNHLTLKLSPDWNPPLKLEILTLGSWNLGADIPSWLDTQFTLQQLDLSNTGISGNVPTWFWDITFLNLSHNHLSGNIPDLMGPNSWSICLTSNQFSGPLPRVGNRVTEINLSNNSFSGGIAHSICDVRNGTFRLENLHIGGNQLTGEIPDCWSKYPSLRMVNLGDNNFAGSIPNSIGTLTSLMSLNLYDNMLSGQIPVSISNCTGLVKIDLSSNHLSGSRRDPEGVGISCGNGSIPDNIGDMKQLESLDLSRNTLSGEMPNSFSAMYSLNYLNLSCNNLIGRIPESTQLMGMDASSFVDGNNLCGPPVTTKCRDDDDDGDNAANKEENLDVKYEIDWFYVLLSLGYAVGLSVFCTTLVLKKSWRRAYFRLLECMWDKLYKAHDTESTNILNDWDFLLLTAMKYGMEY
ncbi:hypothetical protein ACS0TY_004743 [Phlomoides rotata]